MPKRTVRALTVLFVIALIAASCGGDASSEADESSDAPAAMLTDKTEPGADDLVAATEEAPGGEDPSTTTAQPAAPSSGFGDGTAVISLENGEVFEFGVLCVLEPQPNFEYTIVSYDDPANLDISKWSEDAQFSGASVSIYDSTTYDTLWEANTTFDAQGGAVDLTVSGSTVTGTGLFWPEGDPFMEGVQGDIAVTC
jgi:hypothetical protein